MLELRQSAYQIVEKCSSTQFEEFKISAFKVFKNVPLFTKILTTELFGKEFWPRCEISIARTYTQSKSTQRAVGKEEDVHFKSFVKRLVSRLYSPDRASSGITQMFVPPSTASFRQRRIEIENDGRRRHK